MALGFNSGGSTVIAQPSGNGSGSFDNTVTAPGADVYGLLAYHIEGGFYGGGAATFNWGSGNPMTILRENQAGANDFLGLAYIKNPPSGATTIDWANCGSSPALTMLAFSAHDVNGTTPFGTPTDADSGTSLAISSDVGELALAIWMQYNSATAANAPATTIGYAEYNIFFPLRTVAAYDTGANPTTTINFSASGMWVGVSVKPTTGVSTPIWTMAFV